MIARGTVDGELAMVAYLAPADGGGFRDVEPDDARLIKVMFDDGRLLILTPTTAGEQFAFDPEKHPHGEKGRWATTGGPGMKTNAAGYREPTRIGKGAENYAGKGKYCETDAKRIEEGLPPGITERDHGEKHPGTIPADVVDAVVRDYGQRQGNCYEMAAKFVQDNPSWTLTHATLYSRIGKFADKVYFHAFAEKEGMLFEPNVAKFFPRDAFYRYYSITDARHFSGTDLYKNMLRTGHWGAWDA